MHPPPQPADKPKRTGRVLRFLRTACLVVLLLVSAFYLIENWRGARAWKSAQARLAAAGESLDLDSFQPPPVKPEENFCATPALDGIGGDDAEAHEKQKRLMALDIPLRSAQPTLTRDPPDWAAWHAFLQTTAAFKLPADEPDSAKAITQGFAPHAALFEELIQAARDRPQARFDPPLYRITNRCGVIGALKGPSPVEVLENGIELMARASLAANEPQQAASLLAVLWRLRSAMANEPYRQVGMFAILAIHQTATGILLDGLRLRSWNDQNLIDADRQLSALDFRHLSLLTTRWEVADVIDFINRLGTDRSSALREWSPYFAEYEYDLFPVLKWVLRLAPRGWLRQHQAFAANEFLDRMLPPLRDSGLLAWHQSEHNRLSDWREGHGPPQIYSAMLGPSIRPNYSPLRILFADTDTRLLRTACALERHSLRHQQYPETLAALEPDLMDQIPTDLDGQPLRYARDDTNGRYRLWSVGPNLIDDWQGQPPPPPKKIKGRTPRQSPQEALDWLLSFPATPP